MSVALLGFLWIWQQEQRTKRQRHTAAMLTAADQCALLAVCAATDVAWRLTAQPSNRTRAWLDGVVNMSDADFRVHFRFSRATFQALLRLVRPAWLQSPSHGGSASLDCREALLMLLYRTSSVEPVARIASRFGVSASSVARYSTRAIAAVCAAAGGELRWPSPAELLAVQADFVARAEAKHAPYLRGVCGIVDATHVNLARAPAVHAPSYINRKKRYSINVQGVCDSDGRFMHVTIGWPGSVGDPRIFTNSAVPALIERWPRGRYLIADGVYALTARCMAPYRSPKGATQLAFNAALTGQRGAVERAYGRLKARFRCLQRLDAATITSAIRIIGVCFLLHNFAERHADVWEVRADEYAALCELSEDVLWHGDSPAAAKLVRDALAQQFI
jgi:hypothetical protein